jgi:hypothetical protein
MPVLRIPTPLRAYTNGQSEVTVNGSNISDALTDLTSQYPALKPHLFSEAAICARLSICSWVRTISRTCREWTRPSKTAKRSC